MENWVAGIAHYIIRTSEMCNLHESIYFVSKHENKVYSRSGRGVEPAPKNAELTF